MLVWAASARPVRVMAGRTLRAAPGSWKSHRRLVHFIWSDIDAPVSKAGTDELAWPAGRREGTSLPWRSLGFRHTPPPPGRNWACGRLQVLERKIDESHGKHRVGTQSSASEETVSSPGGQPKSLRHNSSLRIFGREAV